MLFYERVTHVCYMHMYKPRACRLVDGLAVCFCGGIGLGRLLRFLLLSLLPWTQATAAADAQAHAPMRSSCVVLCFFFLAFILKPQIMSLEQLAVAKDRKDKLLSRVLKKRIELDFRDRSPHSDNAIHCCRHCAGLFSEKVGPNRRSHHRRRRRRASTCFDFGQGFCLHSAAHCSTVIRRLNGRVTAGSAAVRNLYLASLPQQKDSAFGALYPPPPPRSLSDVVYRAPSKRQAASPRCLSCRSILASPAPRPSGNE